MFTEQAKPFLKWAGGKTQLIPHLKNHLPNFISKSGKIENYVEPFLGGGAFFFFLFRHYEIKHALLMDINKDLIQAFRIIRDNPQTLAQRLTELQETFLPLDEEKRKIFYYNIRTLYNEETSSGLERTARLIFLNKTCYNGLYRLNKKGKFNVPMGRYKNPQLFNTTVLEGVHQSLQNVDLEYGDFSESQNVITQNSLIYLDPPYRPLSATANFTHYSKSSFNDQDQIRLAEFFKKMHQRGAFLMLSNSDPAANGDLFLDHLYQDFFIHRLQANRTINRNASKRNPIAEILVTNYN